MSTKDISKNRKPKRGILKELKSNFPLFVMLAPGVIALLINNYIPMVGIIIAFKKYRFVGNFFSSLFTSKFVGLDNFAFFFKTPYALQYTRNTIMYNAVFILLDILIPVALAIALNGLRAKTMSKAYQSIMFLPFFLSWIVVSYLAYSMFSTENGFVNRTILEGMGFEPIQWYFEKQFWPFILVFFHLWKYTGYNVVVYLASISGIDPEYYEAASLDGASRWQQVKYVTLPLLQPIIIIMTLLAVGRIFNADFGLFFNVPRNSGQLFDVTEVIDTYVYRSLINTPNIGFSAAAGLYQAVIGCCTVLLANTVVRKIDSDKALF
jgi:putative aldouronate transport system permease protein